MRNRAKFGVGISVIVVALAFLAWLGYGESKTYYHTIAEYQALKGSARDHRMRLAGTVAPGSIRRAAGRTDATRTKQLYVTTAIARCINASTATPCADSPLSQIQTSGSHSTSVTRIANRKNSHRGTELIRVTIGHPAHAPRTPRTVSLA